MVMFKLFLAFSKISMFAFGGAYSFLPLMEAELVQNHQWLDESEFLEITGITKLFPAACVGNSKPAIKCCRHRRSIVTGQSISVQTMGIYTLLLPKVLKNGDSTQK